MQREFFGAPTEWPMRARTCDAEFREVGVQPEGKSAGADRVPVQHHARHGLMALQCRQFFVEGVGHNPPMHSGSSGQGEEGADGGVKPEAAGVIHAQERRREPERPKENSSCTWNSRKIGTSRSLPA